MNSIDFKTSAYFTGPVFFLGIVLLVATPLVMINNLTAGLIIGIIGFIILTTHYRLKIDTDQKVYQDYVWILGLKKTDSTVRFDNIEYFFIKKNKVSQTMNYEVLSSTIKNEVFDGYLKFSDEDKVHIATEGKKENLIKKLKPLSIKLDLKIIDYSEGDPKEI